MQSGSAVACYRLSGAKLARHGGLASRAVNSSLSIVQGLLCKYMQRLHESQVLRQSRYQAVKWRLASCSVHGQHEPKSLQERRFLRGCRNCSSACARCTAHYCRAEENTSGNGCGSVGIFLAGSAARHRHVGSRTHHHDCGNAQSRLSHLCPTPNWARKPILVCTVREITRVFGLRSLVCAISKNDPGQFLPEQYIFKEPQYRRAFTKRGSGSFR